YWMPWCSSSCSLAIKNSRKPLLKYPLKIPKKSAANAALFFSGNSAIPLLEFVHHFNRTIDGSSIDIADQIRVLGHQSHHVSIAAGFFRWGALAGKNQP